MGKICHKTAVVCSGTRQLDPPIICRWAIFNSMGTTNLSPWIRTSTGQTLNCPQITNPSICKILAKRSTMEAVTVFQQTSAMHKTTSATKNRSAFKIRRSATATEILPETYRTMKESKYLYLSYKLPLQKMHKFQSGRSTCRNRMPLLSKS